MRANHTAMLFLAGILGLALENSSLAQDVDNPLTLTVGATAKVRIDRNARIHYKASLPSGSYKLVLDVQQAKGASTNIQGGVSILDEDGKTLDPDAIRLNEIDLSFRKVHRFTLKGASSLIFKIANDNADADFWVTIAKGDSRTPIPFVGSTLPTSLSIGDTKTGRLEPYQSAYYVAFLPKGSYKITADFTQASGERTNIQGYVALLDQDGGGQEGAIDFNEIDVTFRKVANITTKEDATWIIRVQNQNGTVNYRLRFLPSTPE